MENASMLRPPVEVHNRIDADIAIVLATAAFAIPDGIPPARFSWFQLKNPW
jgi:hypothetical protein